VISEGPRSYSREDRRTGATRGAHVVAVKARTVRWSHVFTCRTRHKAYSAPSLAPATELPRIPANARASGYRSARAAP